jgi:hypothetical protein
MLTRIFFYPKLSKTDGDRIVLEHLYQNVFEVLKNTFFAKGAKKLKKVT